MTSAHHQAFLRDYHYELQADGDEIHMGLAVNQALLALKEGRAGYGCIITGPTGTVVGRGRGSETPTDCTCHSEVVAIRAAQRHLGGLLHGCTLYSTFEPCMFCCGAICHSKVSRVVWGASRSDFPELYRQRNYNAYDLLADTSNPPALQAGILRRECRGVTAATPYPR